MFIDMFGNKRYKLNLHTHTTLSDGHRTPEEAAAIYRDSGYDAIAITDHWKYNEGGELSGITVIPGCEYNFFGEGYVERVTHIVALFCERDPGVEETDSPAECAEKIVKAGGIAVLAHPAWSLNEPATFAGSDTLKFTEIYNTVSGKHESNRAYSGAFVDLAACRGKTPVLFASDDTHYYDNDSTVASVMVKADSLSREDILSAIRNGDLYATTGPEIHLSVKDGVAEVKCSPAVEVNFFTNVAWSKGHHQVGENITSASLKLTKHHKFVRAEVTDSEGGVAYSQIIRL